MGGGGWDSMEGCDLDSIIGYTLIHHNFAFTCFKEPLCDFFIGVGLQVFILLSKYQELLMSCYLFVVLLSYIYQVRSPSFHGSCTIFK